MVVRILFRSTLTAALFIGLLLSLSVTADTIGSTRLFTLLPHDTLTLTRSTVHDGMRPIRYHSTELHHLPQGSTVRLSLSESLDISLTHDHTIDNPSGSRTWVGRLTGFPASYRAIITDDGEHVHGRIMTPRGVYWLETSEDGTQWLHNPRASGLHPTPFGDDAIVPPYELMDAEPVPQTRQTHSLPDPRSTEQARVDVMLAYTPGLVSRLGSGLPARLDQLVAVANQAYTDSGINMRLRLVHTVQVNYSDTLSNNQALSDITPVAQFSTPPEVAMLGTLRDQYGADLVALIRPYDRLQHGGCGLAWLLGVGQGQLSIQRDAPYGYAVVSDGTSGQSFCADTTLVHELGHNMGSDHDRATAATQASSGGVFDYSYGHGIEGTFGTIMSYINPEVNLFSNPAISCVPGQPCGVDHTAVNSADNARSINNVRFQVAAFRDTEIVDPIDPIDPIDPDPVFLLSVTTTGTGSGTVTSSPSGINCGSLCSVEFNQNAAVTLTATPSSGSTFAGWSGACSGTSSCAVTMTQNRSVTATFTASTSQTVVLTNNQPVTGLSGSENSERLFRIEVPTGATELRVTLAPDSTGTASSALNEQRTRIVGGENADIRNYPWQVALLDRFGEQFCGGSIIDRRWVLTAAHCFPETNVRIRAGVSYKTDTTGQDIAVLRQIIHPNYDALTDDNDIALLELAEDLDLSGSTARAIPLMTRSAAATGLQNPGVNAIITGWGATREGGVGSDLLQRATVPIVANADASAAYDPLYGAGSVTVNMLAAGYLQGGIDACQGDSGGPLVVPDSSNALGFRLAGITSWGEGCGQPGYPGIYTRVSEFEDWINAAAAIGELNGGANPSSGDADLYVRFGSPPTTSVYNCRSENLGNSETCVLSNPIAGTYYILVYGYEAYSGVTLRATVTLADPGDIDADTEVMQQYYLAYYARPADLGGLAYWLPLIQAASNETARLAVLDTIRASFGSPFQPEFVGIYGDNIGVDAFFDRAYANILNRTEQDAAARAYWLGILTNQTQAHQNIGRSVADAQAYARADLLSLLINAALAFPGTRDYNTFNNKQLMAAYASERLRSLSAAQHGVVLESVKTLLANPEIHSLSPTQLRAAVDAVMP